MWDPNQNWIHSLRNDGVFVNDRYHSMSELRTSVADLALRGIEGGKYHEAMNSITLPRRTYQVKVIDGARWLVFRNAKGQEKLIEALWYQASTENTLEREIVAIIKWMNDDIFPEHDAVKTFRDMIIRLASNPLMRAWLEKLRPAAKEIEDRLATIDEKRLQRKLKDISPAWLAWAEKRSSDLFWDFMKIANGSEKELGAIHWLSWAWKLPETYGKLKHMAWCWVIITCVFWLVK